MMPSRDLANHESHRDRSILENCIPFHCTIKFRKCLYRLFFTFFATLVCTYFRGLMEGYGPSDSRKANKL